MDANLAGVGGGFGEIGAIPVARRKANNREIQKRIPPVGWKLEFGSILVK